MINKLQATLHLRRYGHKHCRKKFEQQSLSFYERIDGIKDQVSVKRVLKALKNKQKGGEKI